MKKHKEHITKYEDIRPTLRTFDILNCVYGTQWWNPLHWIMALVGHTAMVYVCKETGQVMVYESTQTAREDGKIGVQLRPMKEWLENYPGRVKLRRVTFDEVKNTRRKKAGHRCAEHIKKYRGTAYPNLKKWRWRWFLANAAIDLPFKNDLQNPDIDTVMFCAMLLGHVFRWCKIIGNNVSCNPAEMQPGDLRPGSDQAFIGVLAKDIIIGPEINLK